MAFFYNWLLVSSWKISGFSVQPFRFFVKICHIFIIFVGKIFFLQNIYGFTPVKKISSDSGQKWAKTRQLLLKTFQLPIVLWGCIVQCTKYAKQKPSMPTKTPSAPKNTQVCQTKPKYLGTSWTQSTASAKLGVEKFLKVIALF